MNSYGYLYLEHKYKLNTEIKIYARNGVHYLSKSRSCLNFVNVL